MIDAYEFSNKIAIRIETMVVIFHLWDMRDIAWPGRM